MEDHWSVKLGGINFSHGEESTSTLHVEQSEYDSKKIRVTILKDGENSNNFEVNVERFKEFLKRVQYYLDSNPNLKT